MRGTNQIVQRTAGQPQNFAAYINQQKVMDGLVRQVGGNADLAARLISTMKRIVSKAPLLERCDPGTVIAAVIYGEIGMNLSEEFGEYSVVPYKDKAAFQIGAKGLQQLAIRSGQYAAMDCFDVREGEFKGRDPLTRTPIFEWIEDDDERENLPIIGYYGFYKLNDSYNNFFQCIYWTHDKILKHANRYSQPFKGKLETYKKLCAGELDADQVSRLQYGSPWFAYPDDEPHIKMCKKTIFKQLLSDGRAPKEVRQAISEDNAQDSTGETVIHDETAGAYFSAGSYGTSESPVSAANYVDAEFTAVDTKTAENEAERPTAQNAEESAPKKPGRTKKVVEELPNDFDYLLEVDESGNEREEDFFS